jgi:nucleotidyltransferase/DNA polymerase involved in DNA repair
MRRPHEPERLYLDFDGFFASVEQLVRPELRGRPVGVTPFAGTDRTCVVACSKEAKAFGVKNVMNVSDARAPLLTTFWFRNCRIFTAGRTMRRLDYYESAGQ